MFRSELAGGAQCHLSDPPRLNSGSNLGHGSRSALKVPGSERSLCPGMLIRHGHVFPTCSPPARRGFLRMSATSTRSVKTAQATTSSKKPSEPRPSASLLVVNKKNEVCSVSNSGRPSSSDDVADSYDTADPGDAQFCGHACMSGPTAAVSQAPSDYAP